MEENDFNIFINYIGVFYNESDDLPQPSSKPPFAMIAIKYGFVLSKRFNSGFNIQTIFWILPFKIRQNHNTIINTIICSTHSIECFKNIF